MELFYLDKFLFTSDILSTSSLNLHTKTERINLKLLCTISYIYIYNPKYSNDNDELMNRFESLILYKANHEDIIIDKYDFKTFEIKYINIDKGESFSFQFKHKTEDNSNKILILILLDGWKIALKNSLMASKEISSSYMFNLIDSLISNDFNLIINEAFFEIESKLLKEFTDYLKIIPKITIKVTLYEGEDKDKQNNNDSDEETYLTALCDRFNLEIPDQYSPSLKNKSSKSVVVVVKKASSSNVVAGTGGTGTAGSGDKIKVIPFVCLTHLCLSNTYINDKGFNKCISAILEKSPSLTHLIVDHNLLTIACFAKLKEAKCFNLLRIDLSYNKFTSNNLIQGIINLVNYFPSIENIQFKSNLIDNAFLIQLNPAKLDKLIEDIRNKTNQSNSKGKISFDLRDNNFDIEYQLRKYYIWKPKNDSFEESILQNSKLTSKIAAFITKYSIQYKHIHILFDHPYLRMSKPTPIDYNINKYLRVKCIKLDKTKKKISQKEIKKPSKRHFDKEIDIYKSLFQYFFLIDFYFDPVMNSFNSPQSYFIPYSSEYMNQYTFASRYNTLYSYIEEWKRVKQELNSEQTHSLRVKSEKAYFSLISKSIKLRKHIPIYEIPPDQADEMYMSYYYYCNGQNRSVINKYLKKVLLYDNNNQQDQDECFNPNAYIDHLYYFVQFFTSGRFHQSKLIPLSSINKLINRIKIEIFHSLNDQNIYTLNKLIYITKALKLPYLNKIRSLYDALNSKAEFIDQGLIKLINFQSKDKYNQGVNPYFLSEINSFLDIFLKEAKLINYKSDPVIVGSHIQFLRNNSLRNKLKDLYESMLNKSKMTNYLSNMNSDYDRMYDQYKAINDYNTLCIPNDIINKCLSFHPTLIDYLLLCEIDKTTLDNDLPIVNKALEANECYGLRNIQNRILFLLLNMTIDNDNNIDISIKHQLVKYKLHRNNQYMKISRMLFRFFNELDMKKACYLNTKLITFNPLKKKMKRKGHELLIEAINFKLSDQIQGYSVYEINKYKFSLLKYSYEVLLSPLFDISKEKAIDYNDVDNYSFISSEFYSALLKTMMNLNSISSSSSLYKKIKNVIRLYLLYSSKYNDTNKNNNTLWLLIQKEFLFLLIKFVNHDSMEFNQKSLLRQYTFGIFYIMTFYMTFSSDGLRLLFKQWVFNVYIKNYYSSYCEGIYRAINNPYRYDYIPSCYEIRNRLDCTVMKLTMRFYTNYSEEYIIDELTTGISLFNRIKSTSELLSNIEEKSLYWLYYKKVSTKEYKAIDGNMFILELLGKLEEAVIELVDQEIRESLELRPNFVFNHHEFWIRRRMFSPMVCNGLLTTFQRQEKLLLFHQMKELFSTSKRILRLESDMMNKVAYFLLLDAKMNKECLKDEKGENDYNKTAQYLFMNTSTVHHLNINEMSKKIEKDLKSQDSLIDDFFNTIKNVSILFSNLYNVCVTNQFEKIETGNLIISIDAYQIKLLNKANYHLLHSIEYEDIVSLVVANDRILYITIIIYNKKSLEEKIERISLSGDCYDVRDILKDILSYMQLHIAVRTNSVLTNCFLVGKYNQSNMKEYNLVYQRTFNIDYDIMEQKANDLFSQELKYFKELRSINPQYQEEMIKLEKENNEEEKRIKEKETQRRSHNKGRKSKFDINKEYNLPRYDKFCLLNKEYNDEDSEEDSIESKDVEIKRIILPENVIKKGESRSDKSSSQVIPDSFNKAKIKEVEEEEEDNSLIDNNDEDNEIQNALYFVVMKALLEFPDKTTESNNDDNKDNDIAENVQSIKEKQSDLKSEIEITLNSNKSLLFDSESMISSDIFVKKKSFDTPK